MAENFTADTQLLEQEAPVESPVVPAPESHKKTARRGARHAAPRAKKPLWLRIVLYVLSGLGVAVSLVVAFFLTLFYSPLLPQWRDQYVLMTYQTSNPWLCTMFFSQESIDAVFDRHTVSTPGGETNTDLIDVPEASEPEVKKEFSVSQKYAGETLYDDGEVQVLKFSGKTNRGKYTARLIQIKDPARVMLGVTNQLGKRGQTIVDMCQTNNALAGINAGGFVDIGGVGNGGTPTELVVKDGVLTVFEEKESYEIIGFNQNNVLVLGTYTVDEIPALNLRDAISWGVLRWKPALILNGNRAEFSGLAGGYDPRSAIAQREDGLVMLLVVDGSELRGKDGANMELVTDILWEFGAVNAANLDGGTSSAMALEGELINTICNPAIASRGRYLATSWLVKNVGGAADNTVTNSTNTAQTTVPSSTVSTNEQSNLVTTTQNE